MHEQTQNQIKELLALGKHLEAYSIAKQSFDNSPTSKALSLSAQLATRVGLPNVTLELYKNPLANSLNPLEVAMYRGHAFKSIGNDKHAKLAYKELCSSDDAMIASIGWWSVADLKSLTMTSEDLSVIREQLKTNHYPLATALLHLAHAKCHKDLERYDDSFKELVKGNQILSNIRPYDGNALKQQLLHDIQIYDREAVCTNPLDNTPIFIVGMPRSGTTLLEQILCESPEITVTDELAFIRNCSFSYQQGTNTLLEARNEYLKAVNIYPIRNMLHFIDKAPNNWINIGLIRKIFPDAKIINVHRPTIDNIMSNYAQYYHSGQFDSYSLDASFEQRHIYAQHLTHYASDDHLINVSYKALVTEPIETISTIFDHLEIAMPKDPLQFYESRSAVLTPSASQVKQPITNSKLGSSDIYLEFLEPKFVEQCNQLDTKIEAITTSAA